MKRIDIYACVYRWIPGPYDFEPAENRILFWALSFLEVAKWMDEKHNTTSEYKIVSLRVDFRVNSKMELELVYE